MKQNHLSIGIDLVLVERMRYLVENVGISGLRRMFTPLEVATALERVETVKMLAGRFALKEAIIKALPGTPLTILDLTDVEITMRDDGSPEIAVPDNLSYQVTGSISHEEDYAIGAAIVYNRGG